MDIDQLVSQMITGHPELKEAMGDARKELADKKAELGDEAYYDWMASHFLGVTKTN